MSQNTNISLTLQAWAEIVIKNWLARIDALGIHDTYELSQSFIHHIISNAGGDIARIEFAFLFYGRFVDMGVGKGIKIGDAGLKETRRRPYKWYSPVIYSEVKKLTEILAEKYARKGAITIVEKINNASLNIT